MAAAADGRIVQGGAAAPLDAAAALCARQARRQRQGKKKKDEELVRARVEEEEEESLMRPLTIELWLQVSEKGKNCRPCVCVKCAIYCIFFARAAANREGTIGEG